MTTCSACGGCVEPTEKYRVVEMSHLGGADMQCTLFVNNSEENHKEIRKLMLAIEALGGGLIADQPPGEYTRQEIENFLAHPLCKVIMNKSSGTTDCSLTYLLTGKIHFPNGLVKKLPHDKNMKETIVAKRWKESSLGKLQWPYWSTICDEAIDLEN